MSQLPPDDEGWQAFLRQHRPIPPTAADDLEERLMSAISDEEQPGNLSRLWAVPPAIAAGLLMAWSSYRTLVPMPALSSSSERLEAFLEHNWNSVTVDTPTSLANGTTSEDWMVLANTAP